MSQLAAFAFVAAFLAVLVMAEVASRRIPGKPPLANAVAFVVNLAFAVAEMIRGDIALSVFNASIAGYFAYLIWQWWRRRRQGRPSRVAAMVRSLGHRLAVVPVRDGA